MMPKGATGAQDNHGATALDNHGATALDNPAPRRSGQHARAPNVRESLTDVRHALAARSDGQLQCGGRRGVGSEAALARRPETKGPSHSQ